MNIMLIAPPLAGKGTQAKLISDKFNIPHISAGDLLREEVEKKTDIGQKIHEIQVKGLLVDNDILSDLITTRLTKPDCDYGFILDGYPRSFEQAQACEEIMEKLDKKLDAIIYLDISKELAISRVESRLVCGHCGASYNTKDPSLMPIKEGICDNCSSSINKRDDDNTETFEKRFDTYMINTYPLIEYYSKQENFYSIKITENSTKESTFSEVLKVIK